MMKDQWCPRHRRSLDYSLQLSMKLGSVFAEGGKAVNAGDLVRREDRG